MLIATEHLGNVGVGVTAPQFLRANDANIYVVKLQNNKLGSKVLVSEFLGAKLGQILGLCFPYSDVINITEAMLESSPALMALDVTAGLHFASRYLENTEYVRKHNIKKAINLSEMAGVILFDHMFHNSDRTTNKKNLLISAEDNGYKIYAIDNSHLFRSGRWTLDALTRLAPKINIYYRYSYGLLLREYLTPQDFIPYTEKISQLSNADIETIISEIPTEWLPDNHERQELLSYIKLRRDMVEDIQKMLLKYSSLPHDTRRFLFGKQIK